MAEEERLENGRPERRARIRLLAKMTDPQGHVHETKHARAGICRMQDGGILLEYDEEQEGERAHVVLTAGSRQAAMRRRGGMSGTLRFVPGERTSSTYETDYGEIPVAVFTHSVAMERTQTGGELRLEYDLFVGGDKTASARMDVTWRL